MPLANVQTGTGDTPQAWYYGLPPITRLYGTVCVLTTLGTVLGLVNPMLLYMHWPLVIQKAQVKHHKMAPASQLQVTLWTSS